jgi:hypothetical protein
LAEPPANPADRRQQSGSLRSPLVPPLWLIGLTLLLGLALAGWIASTAPDFKNLALGEDTRSIYGSYEGDKIFCGSADELPECTGPAAKRGLAKRVVWIGNSQLHAINQPKPTDVTAPVLLARTLRPKGVEVQALSYPNGSLAEFYLAYLMERRAARIDVLVVPLFLDDTREAEIRPELADIARQPWFTSRLSASAAGRALLAELPSKQEDAAAATAGTTLQARSEAAITGWLERCCGFQTLRENARGQIDIEVYKFRNLVFNVTAQTVRPIIPAAYKANMAALAQLLADAHADGTRVITYIAPLRQDVTPPYRPEDYARFKAETRALAEAHGATWIDIDSIVPGPLWGTKAATRTGGKPEYDFMHFQEPGHIAVAQALTPHVEAALQ